MIKVRILGSIVRCDSFQSFWEFCLSASDLCCCLSMSTR